MKTQKFYVVWKGRKSGIYGDWAACAAQVQGFRGARYQAFATRASAEQALAAGPAAPATSPALAQKWLLSPRPPIAESLVVDAACSGNPGRLEWRAVHLASGQQRFHEGPFAQGTNNIGEFLAIVHALAWLEKHTQSLPVYSDSGTAIAWVRARRANTRLERTSANAPLFALLEGATRWLHEHPTELPPVLKWDTRAWGENPADFDRK